MNSLRNILCRLTRLFPVFLLILVFSSLLACSTGASSLSRQDLYGAFSKDEKAGDLRKARLDLSSILKTHPRDPIAWNDLAYLDFLSHDYGKAQGALAQGLALHPKDRFLLLNKARLFLAEGKNEKARSLLLSMMASRPWPKGFRMILAIADLRTGHSDSARVLFSEILTERPHDRLAAIYLSRLSLLHSSFIDSSNG